MKIPKFVLLLCIMTVLICGCVTHTNLEKNGQVTVDQFNPGKVKILWSDATETAGKLVVSGQLKRIDRSATPIPAHVHVLELDSNNEIIQSLESSQVYVHRRRVGRGPNWKRFSVHSDTLPRAGSRIVVIVHTHNETHDDQFLLSICS